MILEQEKLDAIGKQRSNLFNWRGQFTPEFIRYMLSQFAKRGDHVLDPFSGSGTVLQEAAAMGMAATGFEINPSAFSMSAFFEFCNVSTKERKIFIDTFRIKLEGYLELLNDEPLFVKGEDYHSCYVHFLSFIERIMPAFTLASERTVLLNIFFQSEKDKKLSLKASIVKSLDYISKSLIDLPFTEQPISAELNDARSVDSLFDQQIDLVLTSPPYINVFNYHQNYRAIVELLQYNILKVANSEFGSNRKNRGNRLRTVIQYTVDMETAIRAFWKTLKPNGTLLMVLGRESNVRGIPFMNGQLIIDIIKGCGGFSDVRVLERQFMNKFGTNIKEDIIIATRTGIELCTERFGLDIAVGQLKTGLNIAEGLVREDLVDAIANAELIKESPILNNKQIII